MFVAWHVGNAPFNYLDYNDNILAVFSGEVIPIIQHVEHELFNTGLCSPLFCLF